MSLIFQTVEKEDISKETEEGQDQLEEDLCQLWDLSLDTDVMKILHEYKLVTITTGVIQKSKQARITVSQIVILKILETSDIL